MVKTLYCAVNKRHNRPCSYCNKVAVSEPSVIRHQNIMSLFQSFVEAAVAQGRAPKGLEQEFAKVLDVKPSMWSQVKAKRPIGDKLARQFEHRCEKPNGWLDEVHTPVAAPTAAEESFVELARLAWRSSNAKGKRDLRHLVKTFSG